jgi:hypothetical protein
MILNEMIQELLTGTRWKVKFKELRIQKALHLLTVQKNGFFAFLEKSCFAVDSNSVLLKIHGDQRARRAFHVQRCRYRVQVLYLVDKSFVLLLDGVELVIQVLLYSFRTSNKIP